MVKILYNEEVKSVIPLKIHQVWHLNELPNCMKQCINNIKSNNPEFEHKLFTIYECREFIKNNFPENILVAFDSILPYAVKIDLWRYCILYLHGGIYLDVTYYCINNFKLIYLTDREYFCRDISTCSKEKGIYNSLIICKPKNVIILKCINKIVESIEKTSYENNCLCPASPKVLKYFFSNQEISDFKLEIKYNYKKHAIGISWENMEILKLHEDCSKEQQDDRKQWINCWKNRNIYILNNANSNHNDIFTNIYENKIWGDNNNENYSGSSGTFSTIEEQKDYISFIKSFIKENNISSVIDLGCGDFIIGDLIYGDLDINYYGYDTYKKLIDYHRNNHSNKDNYNFFHLDFCREKSEIINGDLCIIKDVLIHWSLNNIYTFLDYITKSNKYKFILICNDSGQIVDDVNIMDGQIRPLSSNFNPLKKYNPKAIFTYLDKEISLITNN